MPIATRTGPLLVGIGQFGLGVLATGIAAYFLGTVNIQKVVNFVPNGTTTGATLQLNGIDELKVWDTACTNTGGLAKYPTCLVRSPWTTTGALKLVSLVCGGTNKTLSMSGGFVKTTTAVVSSAFSNLKTVSVGTGAGLQSVDTGATMRMWNPADLIKFQTVTSFPAGGATCYVHTEGYDRQGI
jgi:hypothetical protein